MHKWWQFKSKDSSKARINEMEFDVIPNTYWTWFNSGTWEPETHAFYQKYVSPIKEVIDIGGWIGPTVFIAYAFNPKKIWVVEADPANYQILKTHCLRNYLDDKVALHCVCISHTTDEIVNFGYTDETIQDTSTKGIGGTRVKVRTISLSDFLKTKDLTNTNIIKIDIEGGEQYIEDGLDYISRFPGIHVLFSIHPPFWNDKRKTTTMLLRAFKQFDVFSDKEEPVTEEKLKALMFSEVPSGYKGKTGEFFTLILKTNAK